MKLFALDSPFMEGMRKLADVIICNLLFIVCSIPIITMGASLAALHECMEILIEDTDNGLIFLDFFRAFRRNFKRATLLGLLCGAVILFLLLYQLAIGSIGGVMGRSYRILFYLLVILAVLFAQFQFPMLLLKKEDKVVSCVRQAVLFTLARFPSALLSIGVLAAALVLTTMIYSTAGYMSAFIWIICGFGLICYFNQLIFGNAARKAGLMPEEDTIEG